MDDLISRQDAIDALHTYFEDGFEQDRWWNSTHVLKAIRGVPSAQPVNYGSTNLIDKKEVLDAIHKVIFSIIDTKSPLTIIDKQILSINKVITTKIKELPSAQQWIPVRMRPMDSEEREYWEEHTGFTLTDDMAEGFDCPMPDDGQRIWVQTKNGFVFDDVCESDCDGIGLEGNGDWDDIVAWMPMLVPAPWEGGEA